MESSIDVGSVIRRTFAIYFDQAPVLMPASAVVFGITGVLSGILLADSDGLWFVSVLLSTVATTLFTGLVVKLVADVQDGRRDATVGQLLRAVAPVLGQLILVGLLAGVGIFLGFLLLVVPGLFLITIWAVFAPVIVLERPAGVTAALGRSRDLVQGNGWQVFGVLLVLLILVGGVGSAIVIAANSAGTGVGLVVRVVVGVLTAPLTALAEAVLYFELRGAGAPSSPPASVV